MRTLVLLLALGASAGAWAIPIWSEGTGSAVQNVDGIVTFDAIANHDDLSGFQENGVSVTVADAAFVGFDPTGGRGGFNDGFFYANGGAMAPYVVDVGGADLLAVEFTVGSGFALDRLLGHTQLYYETFRDGVSTGSGSAAFTLGDVFGLRDSAGFDELHLFNVNPRQGDKNALAIDYLTIERAVVSEPAVLSMVFAGLLLMFTARRR
ncbi:MAG: hypothetical protein AAF184_21140 [Pseudomonadota bacterium]